MRRRCPPPAASGPAAAASPSYAVKVSRPASLWPRRGLPRSKNEPAADSELMRIFDAPVAARRSPHQPTASSTNDLKGETTIKWAGGMRKSPSYPGEYATIHDELQFGRYFALTAGGYAALRRRMNMQQYLLSRSVSASYGANAPRRGCGSSTPFVALQSTLDRSAGSPGALALLRVRLLCFNFFPRKVIELQFGW